MSTDIQPLRTRSRESQTHPGSLWRLAILCWITVLCVLAPAHNALAQAAPVQGSLDWPTRPIRFIVPFGAGGPPDVLARLLAQQIGEGLGQPLIVENRVGAGGTIGTEAAAHAAPDGYTVVLGVTATITIAPSFYPDLRYDPQRDFEPIGQATAAPVLVLVHASLPVRSIGELVALAQSRPHELNFGSSGNGTPLHLAGELFKVTTGVDIVHVPYKDIGPATADFLAGRFQIFFQLYAPMEQPIASGRVRALAVADRRRLAQLPDVPSSADLALDGFEVVSWFGLLAPRGTPESAIRRLNAQLQRALAQPAVRATLDKLGLIPQGGSSKEFAAFIATQTAKWAQTVKRSGARID